jgi:hypothetical protein
MEVQFHVLCTDFYLVQIRFCQQACPASLQSLPVVFLPCIVYPPAGLVQPDADIVVQAPPFCNRSLGLMHDECRHI